MKFLLTLSLFRASTPTQLEKLTGEVAATVSSAETRLTRALAQVMKQFPAPEQEDKT